MPRIECKPGQIELAWLFVATAAVALLLTVLRYEPLFELFSWPPTLLFVAMTSSIFTSASDRRALPLRRRPRAAQGEHRRASAAAQPLLLAGGNLLE